MSKLSKVGSKQVLKEAYESVTATNVSTGEAMETEKAIFLLLPRQLAWSWSQWIWLGDH